ncbi:MAG: DNA repair protein RecN [Alphaproteobacteria bacterium]|nr:DNA repair protein RecN [Alphaproteobacteria bacterium]
MLTSLSVRNLAVIERIDLEFGDGLTVLTGETGAGKSILLDALGLVIGRRADISMIRPGSERASVTATFRIGRESAVIGMLRQRGIECDEELVVRRQVRVDGRSLAHANDEVIGVTLLREIGDHIVECHGQQDQRGLLRPRTHRTLLDAFADNREAVDGVGQAFKAWQQARQKLERLEADQAGRREAADTLAGDLRDLEMLDPGADEEDTLTTARTRLANSRKVAEAMDVAAAALAGERGVDDGLATASAALERVRDVAGGLVDEAHGAVDRALVETAEASSALARAAAGLEDEADRLDEIEDRLFALKSAARRHRTTVAGLLEVRENLARDLAAMEGLEEEVVAAREDEARLVEVFRTACDVLGQRRRKAARSLDAAVTAELAPLRMDHAVFATRLETREIAGWGVDGAETVQFAVVTTPGAAPGPLGRIASGGELSRFMLALRVAGQGDEPAGTLIFDEIDSGVGGAVSDAIGERLRRLGQRTQVLVVTHAPQVAAHADHHILLSRDDTAVAQARTLSGNDRREELARMLAGAHITEESRAAAASLLKP